MAAEQLEFGKNKTVYKEKCCICNEELEDPSFYESVDGSLYALCNKHDNWKFEKVIELQEALLVFGMPVMYVCFLLGVEDKLAETIKWVVSKLEEADV